MSVLGRARAEARRSKDARGKRDGRNESPVSLKPHVSVTGVTRGTISSGYQSAVCDKQSCIVNLLADVVYYPGCIRVKRPFVARSHNRSAPSRGPSRASHSPHPRASRGVSRAPCRACSRAAAVLGWQGVAARMRCERWQVRGWDERVACCWQGACCQQARSSVRAGWKRVGGGGEGWGRMGGRGAVWDSLYLPSISAPHRTRLSPSCPSPSLHTHSGRTPHSLSGFALTLPPLSSPSL